MIEQVAPITNAFPFFKGLPDSDLQAIYQYSTVKDYSRNKPLFHQGDKANRFFAILGGWIKLFRTTDKGEEVVVALFTKGDVFGEASVFDGASYPFSAVAAEESRVLEVPADFLKEQARKNPEITTRMMHSMSREIHKLQMENEHMTIMSAPQRVGCLLLKLSSSMIGKGGTFSFPYDKSLAASRLGMKPETFSRALGQLRPLGVESKGSKIAIESFNCLAQYCCGHCSAELGDYQETTGKSSCGGACPSKKSCF